MRKHCSRVLTVERRFPLPSFRAINHTLRDDVVSEEPEDGDDPIECSILDSNVICP